MTDFIVPILGFILAVVSGLSLKAKITTKKIFELIVGLLIMVFSIWASIDNSKSIDNLSKDNRQLQSKLDQLIRMRKVDSVNNVVFQRYLKDTFGIERQGDRPVKVVFNSTQNYISSTLKSKGLPDSINYEVKHVNDSLCIAPREGSWVHGYFAFDTAQSTQFNNMLSEGMGSPNLVDQIIVSGRRLNTHIFKIYDRPVYIDEPIKLNISAYKNGYIIFGEQGDNNKRYFYRQGKVNWIPH